MNIIDTVGIDNTYNRDSITTVLDKEHKQEIVLEYNSDNVNDFQFPPKTIQHLSYEISPYNDNFLDFLILPKYGMIKKAINDGFDIKIDTSIINKCLKIFTMGLKH